MQRKYFLNVFLICSSTIYAMELTTIHSYHDIDMSEDFVTAVCSQSDRPTRDAVRLTCKKYYKCIISQDELNKNYKNAITLKDDVQIIHWKSLGGLLPHQELAHAVKDNKFDLARWLLTKNKVDVWDAYCRNTEEAVKTSKVEEILPVIRWLLNKRNQATYLHEFYFFADNLKEQYPGVQKIADVCMKHMEYERKQETYTEKYSCLMGRGSWDSPCGM